MTRNQAEKSRASFYTAVRQFHERDVQLVHCPAETHRELPTTVLRAAEPRRLITNLVHSVADGKLTDETI